MAETVKVALRIERIARLAAVLALGVCLLLTSCFAPSEGVQARGDIVSADGAVLAETRDGSGGGRSRDYPEGAATSAVVGSCYTHDAAEGVERTFEAELLAGDEVELTIDLGIQKAAVSALGERTGAAVVMDPESGAVLAMASTPCYDPSAADAGEAGENRALVARPPGSTFKTVTMAAALESGAVGPRDETPAPPELEFVDGVVSNATPDLYPALTLEEAFADSVNTVFAQVTMVVGIERVVEMAGNFGFGEQVMDDLPTGHSVVSGVDSMSDLEKAWAGVGVTTRSQDGMVRGPEMTPVQGAVIAAAIANGGTVLRPYVVSKVSGAPTEPALKPDALRSEFLSPETVDYISDSMAEVVKRGTGSRAAVPGVDVRGKTGTAEDAGHVDGGWFIGFARAGGECYAMAVLVEGEGSGVASEIAGKLVNSLF